MFTQGPWYHSKQKSHCIMNSPLSGCLHKQYLCSALPEFLFCSSRDSISLSNRFLKMNRFFGFSFRVWRWPCCSDLWIEIWLINASYFFSRSTVYCLAGVLKPSNTINSLLDRLGPLVDRERPASLSKQPWQNLKTACL